MRGKKPVVCSALGIFYQLTMADYEVPNGRTTLADYPFPGSTFEAALPDVL